MWFGYSAKKAPLTWSMLCLVTRWKNILFCCFVLFGHPPPQCKSWCKIVQIRDHLYCRLLFFRAKWSCYWHVSYTLNPPLHPRPISRKLPAKVIRCWHLRRRRRKEKLPEWLTFARQNVQIRNWKIERARIFTLPMCRFTPKVKQNKSLRKSPITGAKRCNEPGRFYGLLRRKVLEVKLRLITPAPRCCGRATVLDLWRT